ncbi:hypothetical protein I203_101421 [Kwoniella mangroviensis CBS 8507]
MGSRFTEDTSVLSPQGNPTTQHRSIDDVANEKPNRKIKASLWSRCHDRWFFVAFMINFTLYFVLSAYAIFEFTQNYDEIKKDTTSGGDKDNESTIKVETGDIDKALTGDTTYMLLGATGLALILNFLLLFFIRKFPGFVIWSGPVMAVIFCLAAAGGFIYLQAWGSAAIVGIFGVVLGASLWFLRGKYLLARDLLDTANKGAKAHWSVFWTVLIGLVVEGLVSLWNLFTFVAVYLRFSPGQAACDTGGSCSAGLLATLLIYILISHLWISSVIGNVIILTLAGGPYSRWWFGTDSKDKSESWYALRKATSTSLGSVAFGSLLVGLVETLAFIIKTISLELCGSSIFTCFCFCVINIIEGLLEVFNKYVYVKIGVDDFQYGFIPSAKEIIHIVKKKKGDQRVGLNAMITDCIVGFSLYTTCIACAIVCTAVTYVYTIIIDGTAKVDDWWDWLILVYTFILALNIGLVLTSALEAGVSTTLICLDKDPSKLKDRNPNFYEHEAYGNYRALLEEEK